MLGRLFNERFERQPQHQPFSVDVQRLLRSSDLVVGNLEFTITADDPVNRYPNKTFNYQMDPQFRNALLAGSFDHVSLANNHAMDYGKQGLFDTQHHLRALGISFSGAGRNLSEARRPAILERRGMRIAIFSMTDHYDWFDWAAGYNSPGVWLITPENAPRVVGRVAKWHGEHPEDFIVVSIHWGANYEPEISEWKRTLAEMLAAAGVNVVHGHSAHHVQSIELIDDQTLVIYSNGDFVDDYAVNPVFRNDLGIIVVVTVTGQKIDSVDVWPTRISDLSVDLLEMQPISFK